MRSTSSEIQFLLNGEMITVGDVEPTQSVLTYLRENKKIKGTKEGCAEGDCGACTVVIGELVDEKVELKTVNACIQFLPTLHGKAIYTVEGLKQKDGSLHPVQQAMVDRNGSQCGFCTPGFIMSLWNVYNQYQASNTKPTNIDVKSALTGNLCRCTGYRPILEAAQTMFDLPNVSFEVNQLQQALQTLNNRDDFSYLNKEATFFAPKSIEALTTLKSKHTEATVLAGGTDVGLWVNKQFRKLDPIIYIGDVAELKEITIDDVYLHIGAAATISKAYQEIAQYYPEMNEVWERFASMPIRNVGTIGGNVANGSPIGDSMPALIALGAKIVLRNIEKSRTLLLEDFYLDYMKKDLKVDEVVEALKLPLPKVGRIFRCYKLSKRYDSDISAVFAAFSITLKNNVVESSCFAYGGMAATPKRASHCEQFLQGKSWNESTISIAMETLSQDFLPMTDCRASNNKRMQSAANLLYRFYLETREVSPLTNAELSVFSSNLSVHDIPVSIEG